MDPADDALASLPPGVLLQWGRREVARRGPKPSLTLDEIVAAAIRIADADGLAGLSMARVASEVGVSTMGLYRYVATKDELLLLVSDAGLGLPPSLPSRRSWRRGLEQWAHAVRDVWVQRPWLLRIPVSGPPSGPNNLAWLEAGLAALAGTTLSDGDRVEVVLLLGTYVRGNAWLATDLATAATTDPASFSLEYGGAFASLLDPARYPQLTAAIANGAFDADADPDGRSFDRGLELILDGVAQRIAP